MRPTWIAFGALLTVPLGVTAVHAHHSFAASFTDERIMREGVVERYVFKNPHVLLYIAVADDDGRVRDLDGRGRFRDGFAQGGLVGGYALHRRPCPDRRPRGAQQPPDDFDGIDRGPGS